jgi:hypothetical protein
LGGFFALSAEPFAVFLFFDFIRSTPGTGKELNEFLACTGQTEDLTALLAVPFCHVDVAGWAETTVF